jgi:hypothetical protein
MHGKEVLEEYEGQIQNLEQKGQVLEKWIREFISSSGTVKEELLKLKDKLQQLLGNVNRSLEIVAKNEKKQALSIESVKIALKIKYDELKDAIEREDLRHIMNQEFYFKDSSGSTLKDEKEGVVARLNANLKELMSGKSLDTLNQLVEEFNSKYKIFTAINSSTAKERFVYGTCNPKENDRVLCKFDVSTKKLVAITPVPCRSTTIQIGDHIFISGGRNPCINVLSEFVEETQSLIPKSPMWVEKFNHAICAISKDSFVVIGGYNTNSLSCCEGFSIPMNKWELLPSLNVARECPATTLINNRFLYSIGGSDTNEIEVLDISFMKSWVLLTLMLNELAINNSPEVMKVADEELLIFRGHNTNEVGVFDVRNRTIRKTSLTIVPECFICNSAVEIKGRLYLLGSSGNIIIFNKNAKKLEVLPLPFLHKVTNLRLI